MYESPVIRSAHGLHEAIKDPEKRLDWIEHVTTEMQQIQWLKRWPEDLSKINFDFKSHWRLFRSNLPKYRHHCIPFVENSKDVYEWLLSYPEDREYFSEYLEYTNEDCIYKHIRGKKEISWFFKHPNDATIKTLWDIEIRAHKDQLKAIYGAAAIMIEDDHPVIIFSANQRIFKLTVESDRLILKQLVESVRHIDAFRTISHISDYIKEMPV